MNCFSWRASSLACVIALCASYASAQSIADDAQRVREASDQVTSTARREFQTAVEQSSTGNWAGSLEHLQRAYRLFPHPQILVALSSAEEHNGLLIQAAESARKFLRAAEMEFEGYGFNARTREDLRALIPSAQETVERAESRFAFLQLTVENLGPNDTVRLDEGELPRAALGTRWPVNPGAHQIEIRRGETPLARQEINVHDGRTITLAMEVTMVPRETTPTAPVEPGPSTPVEEEGGSLLASPWFWVVAAVVIAGGVTLGVLLTRDQRDPYMGNLGSGAFEF